MNTVNLGDLVVRMLVSLAVVLGLVYVAYRVMKRRQGGGFAAAAPRTAGSLRARRQGRSSLANAIGASRTSAHARAPHRRQAQRPGVQVMGRQALSRSTGVVAVRFAGRVLLVGTSEQAPPVVLAETDLSTWTAAAEPDEELLPMTVPETGTASAAKPAGLGRPPSLIEALREMTARRA